MPFFCVVFCGCAVYYVRMTKVAHQSGAAGYMVRARVSRKKVSWRDYIIPTNNKKKRRVSEVVDKIVYGV